MRVSEECGCGAVFAAHGRRKAAQFMWATWRTNHKCIEKPEPEEELPERSGAHTDTQIGRSQDGRWIGGYDYLPQIEMSGGLHV